MNIVILGSGISGISCAYHLKKANFNPTIYEKDDTWGGLCGNIEIDGFRFDKFVHFSFTKNSYVRKIFEQNTKFISHAPESSNYYKGLWLRHPVQNNLFPLSVKEKTTIIVDFINNLNNKQKIKNYEDWLKAQYGKYFSENFPMKYTKKYWTVEAKDLETKWVENRMSKPSIEEVLSGAMHIHKKIDYYTTEMRYPEKGGYKSIMNGMNIDELNITLNKDVIEIDTINKKLTFSDGSIKNYDKLVSSIPLTKIVNIIKNTPEKIKNAAKNLLSTSGYIISLGFNKPNIPKNLWFYIYDKDILPSRVYSPSLKSLDNVPKGCSSLQAEVYFSDSLKINMTEEQILDHVIEKLISMEIFEIKDIIVKSIRKEEFANIVFTHKIYKNRKIILNYLNSKEIESIGRFGEWDYLWSDQSFLSGKRAADKIMIKGNKE
jgi:protoporphyrinogen oxidase